jgi:cell division protein FtsQ
MTPPTSTDATIERPIEPPHPRIRARRIEVRRDEGRRRRYRLIGVVVVLALAAGVAGALRSPLFSVHRAVVIGAHHTPVAAVEAAAGVRDGQPLVDFDTTAARRHVLALPWIRTATVTRDWPRAVRITVTERTAVAQAQAGTGWATLDASGRVLATSAHHVAGLVTVTGIEAGEPGSSVGPSAHVALRLAAALPPRLAVLVASVTASASGELSLRLIEGHIPVRIGPDTQLTAKLQSLSALLASAARTPPIKSIDVLVPSVPVLTRQ